MDDLARQPATTDAQKDALRAKYKTLYDELFSFVGTASEQSDTNALLSEIGNLNAEVRRLHQAKKEVVADAETAVARDEALRSRDVPTNPHTLYLLNRPVRHGMIPYLWAIGVLFIGIAIFVWYDSGVRMAVFGATTTGTLATNASAIGTWMTYLLDLALSRTVLLTIIGACLLAILILSLKIGGVF